MARIASKHKDQPKENKEKKPVSVSDMLNLESEIPRGVLAYVDPYRIDPNPYQPRKTKDPQKLASLAASIRERGILQPLLAVRAPGGRLTLIAGERRLEAARRIGLQRVPVLIVEHRDDVINGQEHLPLVVESKPLAQANFKFNVQDAIIDAVVENIQREELDAISEGESYRILVNEYNWTHQEVALRIGKTRAYVTMRISLAEELSPQARELLTTSFNTASSAISELEGPEASFIATSQSEPEHATQETLTESGEVTRVTNSEKRNNLTVKGRPGVDVLRNVARLPKELQVAAAQAIIAETVRLGQLPTTRQVATILKTLTQPTTVISKEDAQQLKLDFGPDFELEVPRWLNGSSPDLTKLMEEENTVSASVDNKEAKETEVERGEVLRRLIELYERDLSRLKNQLAKEEQTEIKS
ncbi:MAG: ParB/RepB/Spo0J family partition protein [Chloroflexota bacterium]|nr:ParB/RepB/Spo0J family partition protein [Chloroflexota bacterium]